MHRDLHLAAKAGDVKIVVALLDHGVPVDAKDAGGWTALMWAATHGRGEVVKALLERSADMEARCDAPPPHHSCLRPLPDYQGCTSLLMAAVCGNVKTVHLLVQAARQAYWPSRTTNDAI